MKRIHIKSYIIIALAIVSLNTSCKKYLNEGPITSTYDEKFWTSQQSVDQASMAMYGQFRSCMRADASFFTFGDLTSGVFLPASSQWNYETITVASQFDFSYVPYLEGSFKNWSRFYQLAAQCNLILEKVPGMSNAYFNGGEKTKNAYLGEALFMRALTYFYVTRVWGDPVYITKTYNNVDYGNIPPVARTSEDKVLDSCIIDLTKAAGYLDFAGGDPEKTIRANKGSVYALMAHIYAWKHDYANAHKACQQVITNGGYSLEPAATYTNLWKGQMSSENIFELPMKFNSNDNNFINSADGYNDYNDWTEGQFNFFATFLKDDQVDGQKSNCWVAPLPEIDEFLFKDNQDEDIRYNNVLTHVDASGGDEEGYLLLKYTNFNYQKPETQTNAYIDNNLVVFRLADILLLDAEAQAMLNDASATANLNKVRNRAGIGDYTGATDQPTLVKEIFLERGRELIGEGSFFFDMIRTNNVLHMLTNDADSEYGLGYTPDRVAQKGYYWPLDMGTLFKTDPLLTQNPYWSAH